ncbi:hypothetical protein [Georgenia sp. H159]|uniref:hypothetical protein n=1 Tax=Georgenia sp. H159 TaxID=3076115 RepID=UPI002D776467|nr:hypothetical protein [Georgenia sp. H159]
MTTTKRLTAVVLLLALVLAGVLVLRPTGSTLAAWSDEVTVTVPTLRTGGVRMDVTPSAGTTATVGMSGDVSGTWRPSTVRVSVDGRALTGAELTGSRVEYRVAAAGGTCPTTAATYTATPSGTATDVPVTGGQPLAGARTLCLTFVPTDRIRIELGSRTVSFATTLDGVTVAPATWTTTGSWATELRVTPGPSVTGPTCSSIHPRVTLGWDWNRAGMSVDVARWSVQVADGGTWREVATLMPAQRTVTVGPSDFTGHDAGTHTVRVVAVLTDGTTVPGTTHTEIRIDGTVTCA